MNTQKEWFRDRVEMVDLRGEVVGAMLIYLGDISTLDGMIANWLLERFPLTKNTDLRHYIVTAANDEDGRPLKTIVGSLNQVRKTASHMLDQQFGVVDNPQLGDR